MADLRGQRDDRAGSIEGRTSTPPGCQPSASTTYDTSITLDVYGHRLPADDEAAAATVAAAILGSRG